MSGGIRGVNSEPSEFVLKACPPIALLSLSLLIVHLFSTKLTLHQ